MEVTGVIRRTWRVAIMIAIATTVCAVYLLHGQTGASAAGTAPRFTAVQLSDAVLFNEGPAAPLLASLQRGTVPWTPTLRLGQTAVNGMLANNPGWADSIAAGLQSGNPNAVQGALSQLSILASNALYATYGSGLVVDAFRRFASIASGRLGDIASGIIPFNYQRVCCLEPYVDPIVSSVLTAFLQNIWSPTAGGQPPVTGAIATLMIARVTSGMWAA